MIRESSQLHDISCVLLISDFNVPAIDWQELTYSGISNTFTAEFLCVVQDKYLSQHVTLSHLRSKESTGIHKSCIPDLLSYQGYI